jgi:CCR4-NOT transcription complex subunit 4
MNTTTWVTPGDFQSTRTTMSDDGDRTCPLCAEEMDITDQQLKPCKCGYDVCLPIILLSYQLAARLCLRYAPSSSNNNCCFTLQICVWCWHHIIDMAEKEETEGRCPACRTRYDKDRIVKMAATCDRSVAMLLFLTINFCFTSTD